MLLATLLDSHRPHRYCPRPLHRTSPKVGCRLPRRRLVLDRQQNQDHHRPRFLDSIKKCSLTLVPSAIQRLYCRIHICAAHRGLPHLQEQRNLCAGHTSASAPSAIAAASAPFLHHPAPTSGGGLKMNLDGSEKSRSLCHLGIATPYILVQYNRDTVDSSWHLQLNDKSSITFRRCSACS